ncbi:MAG: peptidase M61, partial [Gammaproteobacteria bacterium]
MATKKNPGPHTSLPEIPAPRDVDYPGTLKIEVDASDTTQGIFRVHETLPVAAGPLVLLYPKWIPGYHSPGGPIAKLAGLKITAAGQPLAWLRNQYDVYAFHVEVPQGIAEIALDYQYLSPRVPGEGAAEMSSAILDLVWSCLVLYPAGHYSRRIVCEPSVKLPSGWHCGTALESASREGDRVVFRGVALDQLVDSPLIAGRYHQRLDLAPGAQTPVHLELFADAPRFLEVKEPQLAAHRALVTQALRLFGAQHYRHYSFLLALTEKLSSHKGVEHHQSSENGT